MVEFGSHLTASQIINLKFAGVFLLLVNMQSDLNRSRPTDVVPPINQSYRYSESVSINFEVHGRGRRRMLLLHGFGASLETWRDIMPWLEENYCVYLLDLKGFGLSSKPADHSYSPDEQARIVAAFIKFQKLTDVILVGHSYGGTVAIMTYLSFKDGHDANPITSLILIDSPGYPQQFPFFVSILRQPLINRMVLSIVPAGLRARYTLQRIFFDSSMIGPDRVTRYARFFDLPGSHDAIISSAKQIIPKDLNVLVKRIPEIAIPVLIIWGENDPVVPLTTAFRLNKDILGSQLQIISRCGHVPHEEKPNETSRIIRSFLN